MRIAALLLACALLPLAGTARAFCPPHLQYEIQRRNIPPWEAQRICGPLPATNFVQPTLGATCVTPVGPCQLPTAVPRGAPCWCATPIGPMNGAVN